MEKHITKFKDKGEKLHIEWQQLSGNSADMELHKVDFPEHPHPDLLDSVRNLLDHVVEVFEVDTTNAHCNLLQFEYDHTDEKAKYTLSRKIMGIDEKLEIKTGWNSDVSIDVVDAMLEEITAYVDGKRAQSELFRAAEQFTSPVNDPDSGIDSIEINSPSTGQSVKFEGSNQPKAEVEE